MKCVPAAKFTTVRNRQRDQVNRRLVGLAYAAAGVLTIHACASRVPDPRGAPSSRTVLVEVGGVVRPVPLEEYVLVTVLSEFAPRQAGADALIRMLEVQAVVSRTYAMTPRHASRGFDFCATSHCQLYDPARLGVPAWAPAASEAVRRTSGKIVSFDGRPARVVFHADCGGHTSSARDVWRGADPPYLIARADSGAAGAAHAGWRFAPEPAALVAALNADERTRVGRRLDRIDVLRRDDGGRAELVALDGEQAPVVRGEELRVVLARAFGARSIRSTRFTVARTDRGFEFTGSGFGHGVGLCQVGAFARIAAGATADEVLGYYFPGTSLH